MFNDANMRKLNLSNFNGSKLANIAGIFSAHGQNVLYPEIQLNSLVLNDSVYMFNVFKVLILMLRFIQRRVQKIKLYQIQN